MSTSKPNVAFVAWLQSGLTRLCRIHFVLIGLYIVYTIASDATNFITPRLVLQRWIVTAVLLIGIGLIWYASNNSKSTRSNYFRWLIYVVITLDIIFATFNVYTQRGMASRGVALYAIPIVVSSILLSRTALFLTAILSTATYSLAAVKYFVDFFNEGYKAELYIEVAFYCIIFFILAASLSIIVRFNTSQNG